MNMIDTLEKYSHLCDSLDELMQAENRELRTTGSANDFLSRKEAAVAQLTDALATLRSAETAPVDQRARAKELHGRTVQKILKLLMLSRESEQLLLKSLSPKRTAPPARTNFSLARQAYQNQQG